MIPYSRHIVTFSDVFAVGRQLKFGSLTQGKTIEEFENTVAEYVGAKFAVAVSSATAGLHISLLALGLEKGKKVVTSPLSFLTSANAILYAGLKPEFVDINPITKNLDPDKLEQILESEDDIVAVIPVHYAGLACDMKKISDLCKKYGVHIVEDAAHALGGKYSENSFIGNNEYSDLTVFSFHPVKSVTTGEGGVITTNSTTLYNLLNQYRSHGLEKVQKNFVNSILAFTNGVQNSWYREMKVLGFHYRLTEIQARLGISQMRKLQKFVSKRTSAALYYDQLIGLDKFFKPAQIVSKEFSGNHLYPIEIDFKNSSKSRNEIMVLLKSRGIGTQVHYMPIPMNPYYSNQGYEPFTCPNAMNYYFNCISIPLHPKISRRQQRYIIRQIDQVLR